MKINVLSVREKVQAYLVQWFNRVQIDKDGDFAFHYGSTQVWISVGEVPQTETMPEYVTVRILANTNNRVPPSPALFEYVATRGRYRFGALRCYLKDDVVRIFVEHTLVGDYLDPDELFICFREVAETADKVDDEIKAQFGGKVYHEGSK